MAGGKQWVSGGELGSSDKSAQDFKQIILDILQEGENVTKALKRLKPPAKRAASKRKTRAAAKKGKADDTVEQEAERGEKDKQFNLLTEAAGELMSLGFEDIYQDSKSDIAANLHKDAEGANRGGAVFHDDGTVRDEAPEEHAMYQRNADNDALGYQESAQTTSTAADNSAEALQKQIPTPSSAAISDHKQATLDGTVAETASTAAEEEAPADATGLQSVSVPSQSDAPEPESDIVPDPAVSHTDPVASASSVPDPQSGAAAPSEIKDAGIDLQNASASTTADQQQLLPDAAQQLSESDAAQPAPSKDSSAAAASVEHITQTEDAAAAHATPAVETAKEVKPSTSSATGEDFQAEAQNVQPKTDPSQSGQPIAETSKADVDMPDSDKDTALDAAVTDAAPSGQSTAQPAANVAAPKANSLAQGERWKGPSKGPGLGNSREFSGGPMYAERPKFRHAPYGTPPIRPSGRFGFAGGRFPGARTAPTGRVLGGRGPFNEPPRSSTMRPQYTQHAPVQMPHSPFPPSQYGAYPPQPQPPPPRYQRPSPYYPPPQQPYPPPSQPAYPQYQGQQTYPAPPQQAYPPYHEQQYPPPGQPPQYAPPAQPPQHGTPWQQHQAPPNPNAAPQQPFAYPAAHAFPPPA